VRNHRVLGASPTSEEDEVGLPEIVVPAGSSALVLANLMETDGFVTLKLDDRAIIAELTEAGLGDDLHLDMGTNQPPDDDSDAWDRLSPIAEQGAFSR
jgi:hypothetical protein